jgi:hypothetical protein
VAKITRSTGASDNGPVRRVEQRGGVDVELTGPSSDLNVGGRLLLGGSGPEDASVEGSILRGLHSLQILWDYTLSSTPDDPAIGTAVHVDAAVTVDSATAQFSTGNFGPRGVFNFEGTTTYEADMDVLRIAPLGFVDTSLIKNDTGSDRTLVPAWSFLNARRVEADAATVTLEANDTNAGGAAFASHAVYRTFSDGLITGTDNDCGHTAFHCSAGWQGNVTLPFRYGLHVGASAELVGTFSDTPDATITDEIGVVVDEFTIGTNKLGMQSVHPVVANEGFMGGRDASDSLILGSTMHATRGRIEARDPLDLITEDKTFTATPIQLLLIDSARTITLDVASWAFRAYDFAATIVAAEDSGTFQSVRHINANPTVKNDNGSARTINGPVMFQSAPVLQADGATLTVGAGLGTSGFMDNPTFGVINGGTVSCTEWVGFRAAGSINASATITTKTGFRAQDPGGAGTITTQIGVDIAALAKGGTNIGIRNASSYVATPTAQTISAVGNTLSSAAELVELTNSSGGSLTMTATPAISVTNQTAGKRIRYRNVGTQNIVLQDEAQLTGTKLRTTSGTSITLTPRDCVDFQFVGGSVNEWYQAGPVVALA